MNSMARLQRQFQALIVNGDNEIEASVIDGPRVGAVRRLAIYANAYRARLAEVLGSDYPALHALAGDELFGQLAYAYLAAHPSTHPNARWFGRNLPSFLTSDPRFSTHGALIEMTRFEWAMGLAFDAADDPILSLAQLAQLPAVDWPSLRLVKHASLQRLELSWNVPDFWLSVQRAESPPALARAAETSSWIVWRRALTTYYRSLETDEAWTLDAVCQGKTFADLCEGLGSWHEPTKVPARAMELLKGWVEEGLLHRCLG